MSSGYDDKRLYPGVGLAKGDSNLSTKRFFRLSDRPSLQYVQIRLRFSKLLFRRYPTGLDVASAGFANSYLFRTKNYLAMDIERPTSKLPLFPGESHFALGDMLRETLPSADLVMCMETIGINTKFDATESLNAVIKLTEATNKGGSLVFNLGPLTDESQQETIQDHLQDRFRKVSAVIYGRWSTDNGPILALMGALLFVLFPPLMRPSKEKPVHKLFFCEQKI